MIHTVRIVLIALLLVIPAGMVYADAAGTAYEKVRTEYYKLQRSEDLQKYRHNWNKVIKGFLNVSEKYPGHKKAADALYMAGRASRDLAEISYNKSDKQQAILYFDQLVESYPKNSLADDSLYLAGGVFESLNDKVGAYIRYQRVAVEYPDGDMKRRADRKLSELKLPSVAETSAPPVSAKPAATTVVTNVEPRVSTPTISAEPTSPTQPPAQKPPSPSTVKQTTTSTAAGKAQITGIRYWSNPDYTRVVIDLDKKAVYKPHFLKGDTKSKLPARLFVDINGAEFSKEIPNPLKISDGLLQRVRLGKPVAGTSRVVIDLESIDKHNVFSLSSPYRIVFDIFGKREAEIKSAPVVAVPNVTPSPSAPDDISKLLKPEPKAPAKVIKGVTGNSIRRIVVDAGHGGKDPGAVGKKGTLEKDIVLKMAKMLAKELKRELGCEVVLTRDRDIFIPLEERTAIANKVGADLFISLHANASTSRKVYGVETFYLNFSKNEKAMAVVARENDTSLKEVGDLDLILFDLMANSKINESSRLAAEIQKSLVKELKGSYSKIRNLGVKQGPFYVLLGATMPSVLVETAFISNAREEQRLKEKKYQKLAVKGIVKAVKEYRKTINRIAMK